MGKAEPDARRAALEVHAEFQTTSPDALRSVSIPVLVLNGGADGGASKDWDLAPFVSGAQRIVVGTANQFDAPSDPLFQAELVRFLRHPAS
jgi:hypothetical protein